MPPRDNIPHRTASHREMPRRRKRRKRHLFAFYAQILFLVLCLALAVGGVIFLICKLTAAPAAPVEDAPDTSQADRSIITPILPPEEEEPPAYTIHTTADTATVADEFPSQFVILFDMESGAVLAEKNADTIISPASMTKILTLLVAAEHITNLDGTFTMTREVADYCFSNQCSVVGYEVGEEIPIQELFYGCILCSGADACLGLAQLATGSHEAFVVRMNEKLEELGLSETAHFTNCVGIYDEEHYCTVQDMGLILKAALENTLCRQVLTTKIFNSEPTPEHPEGQVLSNWFVRRIEEEDTGSVTVPCAKTGYVQEAGFCAASYGENKTGQTFICVTGNSTSTWQSIYDHAQLYRTYCPAAEGAGS